MTHTLNPSLVNEDAGGIDAGAIHQWRAGVGATNYTVSRALAASAETCARFPGLPGSRSPATAALTRQPFGLDSAKASQYNLIDNLTWVRNTHSLKAGTDIRWFSETDENCAYCRSYFTFTGSYTGQWVRGLHARHPVSRFPVIPPRPGGDPARAVGAFLLSGRLESDSPPDTQFGYSLRPEPPAETDPPWVRHVRFQPRKVRSGKRRKQELRSHVTATNPVCVPVCTKT